MERPQFFTDGLMSELDIELVMCDVRNYFDNVLMLPEENIRVFLQNIQECISLLLGERGFKMYPFRSVVSRMI